MLSRRRAPTGGTDRGPWDDMAASGTTGTTVVAAPMVVPDASVSTARPTRRTVADVSTAGDADVAGAVRVAEVISMVVVVVDVSVPHSQPDPYAQTDPRAGDRAVVVARSSKTHVRAKGRMDTGAWCAVLGAKTGLMPLRAMTGARIDPGRRERHRRRDQDAGHQVRRSHRNTPPSCWSQCKQSGCQRLLTANEALTRGWVVRS
jgi:hypothetical protein